MRTNRLLLIVLSVAISVVVVVIAMPLIPAIQHHNRDTANFGRHKSTDDLVYAMRAPRVRPRDKRHLLQSNAQQIDSSGSAQTATNTSCQHSSVSSRAAILGIRCDLGCEVNEDGAIIIKANEPTPIYLIGINLSSNLSVALTPYEGQAQNDCTHTDRVKSFQMLNVTWPSSVTEIVVDMSSPGGMAAYYLCLRDSNQEAWFHQGSKSWLKLYVKQDFLPLYMKIIVIACLLMLSGLFSGLNLGLMALDKNELQVIISCGSETEKRYARAIEPVRKRGNYLLCSILFSNVLVNSTIAVLLEELTSGIVAVMTSTIFIVMFGEILPQAFCSRHGLAVGAKTVSITYFCMIVTFPLSYPVSCCLDWALGEEIGHAYDRERLMEFIRVTRDYNNLETDEVNIISGALKLKRIQLSEIMTRIEDVYMLDIESCLDFDTIQAIIERGYSRIPVHEAGNKKNIVALLFAKDLALLDPDDKTPVQTMISFYDHPIMYLFEDTTLDLALNEFKTGKSHMAFVRRVLDEGDRDPVYEITGIVTLEDVIEEIMQMEINDETDTLSDNKRKRRRKEAQVRKDFSQFTNLGAGDSSHNVVTPQLCLATYQYLATTVEPFSPKYISDTILKRLLSQKIYYKVRVDDHPPRERRLYTAGEPADYFVMVLEGRVHVICGKEGLVFDAGPFSFFGKAVLSTNSPLGQLTTPTTAGVCLDKQSIDSSSLLINTGSGLTPTTSPNAATQLGSRKESTGRQPLIERRESLATVGTGFKSLNNQFSISMRKLEQLVTDPDNLTMQTTAVANEKASALSLGARIRPSESRGSIYSMGDKSTHIARFIPDYSVEIKTNTSYLKITRTEYMTAYRATLVERGGCLEENEGQGDSSVNGDETQVVDTNTT